MPTASEYDFGAAFARIEEELISSMMRNLQRYHLDWEEAEGFDWAQWQVEQLRYLEEYRQANQERFGSRFSSINAMLEEAIRDGYANGQKAEELSILETLASNRTVRRRFASAVVSIEGAGDAFFRVNDRKLEALLAATRSDMERAEWAVLRRADDQYRRIIFNAQMYANTGAGTVQKAVDMATKDFLMRGIDCIEYRNGARHTISDYADMAIRTAERRAYLYGEGQKRQEWGVSLVIVNKRGGHPCPHCAKWVGKILIDDVYSGGLPDGKHTLLSEAMDQGFLHPRCEDGLTTYFPGVTSVPDPATKEELREAEAAEAEEVRQQNAERMAERWDRRARYSLDPADYRAAQARAEEWKGVAKSRDSVIINTGDEGMVGLEIEIDEFTPCLRDTRTGKIVDTSFSKANPKEITGLKKQGWLFNWRHPSLKESEIYKLTLQNGEEIQGLIALEAHPRDMAYHISLAESAPHNKGQEKHFEGVGGHLFAIAAKKSYDAGYGGFIFFEAKSQKLADYYSEKFGAVLIRRPHEYSMIIDEDAALKLLDSYTLD